MAFTVNFPRVASAFPSGYGDFALFGNPDTVICNNPHGQRVLVWRTAYPEDLGPTLGGRGGRCGLGRRGRGVVQTCTLRITPNFDAISLGPDIALRGEQYLPGRYLGDV